MRLARSASALEVAKRAMAAARRVNALRYGSFGSGGVLFGNMRGLLACSKA
jgi:hypothetical protein